ncbi:MAG: uncharacterized protein KVP18_004032 [Porospora cf. gigantea A]|uniref:uncharacterized protein n=1 Tax=Porospora cf. gigantea A TaxID=2853593 RepID=UPI0035598A0F|nr:MAG: hypothetical protein KVP18_004032 [Porospora cf. gigantea A]
MENPEPVICRVTRERPAYEPFAVRSCNRPTVEEGQVVWPSEAAFAAFWGLTSTSKSVDETESTAEAVEPFIKPSRTLLQTYLCLRDMKPSCTGPTVTTQEVFSMIRSLRDPEHTSLTLEQLFVVKESLVDIQGQHITVRFTPTIPHCSQATIIGLMIRVQLLWLLPSSHEVSVMVTEGTHANETSINKQLGDKERVQAALENPNVIRIVLQGLSTGDQFQEMWRL